MNDSEKRTKHLTVDELSKYRGSLPEGVDINDLIREASHDGIDRRYLRLQVQFWREEHDLPGLDEPFGYNANLVDLDGLVQKLTQWYTVEELQRLMPEVFGQVKEE